jgi:hypothetical protein
MTFHENYSMPRLACEVSSEDSSLRARTDTTVPSNLLNRFVCGAQSKRSIPYYYACECMLRKDQVRRLLLSARLGPFTHAETGFTLATSAEHTPNFTLWYSTTHMGTYRPTGALCTNEKKPPM